METFVPVSEAKARLNELVRLSEDQDVTLMRHGRPAAVIMSAERHEALIEHLEDTLDRLSVYEREDVTMPLEKLVVELGLDAD